MNFKVHIYVKTLQLILATLLVVIIFKFCSKENFIENEILHIDPCKLPILCYPLWVLCVFIGSVTDYVLRSILNDLLTSTVKVFNLFTAPRFRFLRDPLNS